MKRALSLTSMKIVLIKIQVFVRQRQKAMKFICDTFHNQKNKNVIIMNK